MSPCPTGPAVGEVELKGSANSLCPLNPARPGREQR